MRPRLVPLLLLALVGCGSGQGLAPDVQPQASPTTFQRNPKIPVDVSYPIISDTDGRDKLSSKRTVYVRLNQKISPQVLREIALDVKGSERRQYEQTFIFYYLPQRYGAEDWPWAISHFNPVLEIEIMGMTREAEQQLRKVPLGRYGDRIGAWLIESQYISRLSVLYETEDGPKLDDISPSGKPLTHVMIELPSRKGRRFKKVKGSDIYEVDERGVLRIYDSDEKLMVAEDPLK